MGLFSKKNCCICGEKVGLLGGVKLKDGDLCKECKKKLSPFFDDGKESTVEDIKKQIQAREENYKRLDNLEINKIYGEFGAILIDETNKKFVALKDTSESLFGSPKVINGIEVNNEGVINCGVLIAIEGLLTDSDIKISVNDVECEINNFSSYKYHIVDGLNGKILCDSVEEGIFVDLDSDEFEHATNNFINTTLVEFPYLVPGNNTVSITCDAGSISRVIVKHYPLFVI